MAIEVISKLEPKNSGSFPVLEDIHLEGGYQVRLNVTDRNNIPTLNRKEGMLVYVVSVTTTYRLGAGLTNGDWSVEGAALTSLLSLTTDDAIIEGNLLRINTSGNVIKADSTDITNSRVIGVSAGVYLSSSVAQVRSLLGTIIPVKFGSAPASGANSSPVYLSSVSGEATLTPPVNPGTIIYFLGILQGADGISTTPDIIFQPRHIAKN